MGARNRLGEGLQALSHTAQLRTEPAVSMHWVLPATDPRRRASAQDCFAVLLELLGPQQNPFSRAPFGLQRNFQEKGEIGFTSCY